jgi:CubicO group peptidase (beta-lactamase class C family)
VFPEPGGDGLPTTVSRRLDRALRAAVAGYSTLGVTAAVVTDDGAWAGAAGSGMRGEPLTPRSSLMYASITKTFTAAEVVLLASRGALDLDKPISDYVDFPGKDNGATVRQVLRMRSGLPAPDDEGLRSSCWRIPTGTGSRRRRSRTYHRRSRRPSERSSTATPTTRFSVSSSRR